MCGKFFVFLHLKLDDVCEMADGWVMWWGCGGVFFHTSSIYVPYKFHITLCDGCVIVVSLLCEGCKWVNVNGGLGGG